MNWSPPARSKTASSRWTLPTSAAGSSAPSSCRSGADEGGPGHRGRLRHRPGGGAGPGRRGLDAGAARTPRGQPARNPAAGAAAAGRRRGRGAGRRCVCDAARAPRPAGPAVQQRRHLGATAAHRRTEPGAMAGRGRHQPDRQFPVRTGRFCVDEGPVAARRSHHQQRLHLGPQPEALLGALHGHQARDHRPHQGAEPGRPRA
mmetsp:Transcript_5196/g.19339  ORF Transcript_5196/g.19339 Transcript_5196/m.19339 type:complete len:203 (+) Transcript_5196:2468-3076(+)